MDAVLLEKAETQQNLVLLRKDNEKAKQQAQDALEELARLREQLDQSSADHLREMEDLKQTMDASHAKYKVEVEKLQLLLKEKEEKEQGEGLQQQELEARLESVRQNYEGQLSSLRRELETAEEERLRQSQEEAQILREEAARIRSAHEEEVRELTEQLETSAADFEMERERLLLLQDEPSEQLSLKDSFLQDVQEEEEDAGRAGGGRGGTGAGGTEALHTEDRDDEMGQLRLALEDLQSQNSMLQEELIYLGNVKAGLEAELLQAKEDFQLEKEELEFKVNELQMCREDGEGLDAKSLEQPQVSAQQQQEIPALEELHRVAMAQLERDLLLKAQEEKEIMAQEVSELRERCDRLFAERNVAVDECEETKEILRNLEVELGERTGEFVKRYDAMKEQGAAAVQELQEKLRASHSQNDGLRERLRGLELAAEEAQVEEELRSSLEALREKNKDILSLLQEKESAVQELEEQVSTLASEKEAAQGALEAVQQELERARKDQSAEQGNASKLELCLHSLTLEKEEMQKRLEQSTTALEEREHAGRRAEGMLEEVAADREQLASELQALREEVAELRRREELLREEATSFGKERAGLEDRLRSVSEERDELRMDAEVTRGQLCGVQERVLELLGGTEASEGPRAGEKEASDVPALVESLVAAALQEKRSLLLQSQERVAQLTEELEQAKERSDQQEAELRARVEELGQERTLLQGSLDEVLADTQALQGDLAQMKDANDRIRAENQELLTQMATAEERLQASENKELGDEDQPLDKGTDEREELRQLLAEKDLLISKLQDDIALLQGDQREGLFYRREQCDRSH
ncbi:hypothetical protein ANANG_G00277960 [Anguilla anguilla]|uniref:Uncharacterized protein n=1 Tax=Anguilla anguilla TaxID=7936 RepID=A0A9D3LVX2_ANGAN|nr:hypothetical protein ANANG_G00277960 [Anguilla anguilla]